MLLCPDCYDALAEDSGCRSSAISSHRRRSEGELLAFFAVGRRVVAFFVRFLSPLLCRISCFLRGPRWEAGSLFFLRPPRSRVKACLSVLGSRIDRANSISAVSILI